MTWQIIASFRTRPDKKFLIDSSCTENTEGFSSFEREREKVPAKEYIFVGADISFSQRASTIDEQCLGSVLNWIWIRIQPKNLIRIRIRRTLNPDPDPSYFLRLRYLRIIYNHFIIIPFYHQKKSIERYDVVKSKIILGWFNILNLFSSPWIRTRRIRFRIQKTPESGSETLGISRVLCSEQKIRGVLGNSKRKTLNVVFFHTKNMSFKIHFSWEV